MKSKFKKQQELGTGQSTGILNVMPDGSSLMPAIQDQPNKWAKATNSRRRPREEGEGSTRNVIDSGQSGAVHAGNDIGTADACRPASSLGDAVTRWEEELQ